MLLQINRVLSRGFLKAHFFSFFARSMGRGVVADRVLQFLTNWLFIT